MGNNNPEYPDYPTPLIAQFDQHMAHIEETLQTFINIMGETLQHHRREDVIPAIANAITERSPNHQTTAQYLAIAIYRLHEIQTQTLKIITQFNNTN